jgi:Na+/H+ antiporter NhaC
MTSTRQDRRIEFFGGPFAALVPIVVLVGGLTWLSIEEKGGAREFWVFAWLGLVAGLLFAKNKGDYCRSALKGLTDESGVTIIIAWLFAGVLGKVMVAGGLVEGILWLGALGNVNPSVFVLVTFVSSMLFAIGTGTSAGTALALAPVLYPAGVMLGADPVVLALAILSGGVFGDNLAPISDSTVVSAFTQGATLKDVVRSRFPLAIAAAGITGVVLFIAGSSSAGVGTAAVPIEGEVKSTLMLVGLIVVVVSALRGKHLVEAMVNGIACSVVAGVLIGNLKLSQLVHIPDNQGDSTGLIQDGLGATQNAIIFVLLLLAVTQVVVDSGIMEKFLSFVQRRLVQTVRQAELAIVAISVAISIPISSNAAAGLLVGPSLVRPLGEKFNLAPARRANLMDCAVCSVFYMLPWHIGVLVWHTAIVDAANTFSIAAPSIRIAAYNPYSWAILCVILFSAYSGWNRRFADVSSTGPEQR